MARKVGTTAKLAEYRRKRDFSKTREPSGGERRKAAAARRGGLRFVIQKHAATRLHFDLRLELDGVMKSWAVPKGPSLDPSVKRLAMEVEDHPIEYNTFEGTIPKGEYGGGTVMLWDRGTYTADPERAGSGDPVDALRRGYAKGDLKFVLHGERLRGSWVLVRTKRGDREKPQWLLIKHRDEVAEPGSDIVADAMTSVDSGRTMEEIAGGNSKVWHSNRPGRSSPSSVLAPSPRSAPATAGTAQRRSTRSANGRAGDAGGKGVVGKASVAPAALEPMYASIGTGVPEGEGWTYEPKYDGIRVLAFVTRETARLITRNGKDKSKQFPEVVETLKKLAGQARRPFVLDGEIVALVDGAPARFQELQNRMHVQEADAIAGHAENAPAALIAFDILLDGDHVLVHEPWSARRARLEQILRNRTSARLRLSESIPNDGERMLQRARADGWEGVIAKRMDAPYTPGVRSRVWLKLKIENRQEFVIGGYTEPRNSREHIGALLLGYFDRDRFIYVGHTGGGFTREGLRRMAQRLEPLQRKSSPFEETPKTNERAHWVEPRVVVEVKFSEWTADGKLRQPIYLGTRDDKDPREVGLERASVQGRVTAAAGNGRARRTVAASLRVEEPVSGAGARQTKRTRSAPAATRPAAGASIDVVAQLDLIERGGGDGTLSLGRGATLEVSNLGKLFFPEERLTKGDLMRFYARVAPVILPVVADRPLVLKRFPNGIAGPSFYQQNAPDEVPDGVRVEVVRNDEGEEQRRIVGGNLLTLLWTVQLGSISVDPWHSRVQSCDYADYTVLDLDPGPRAPFRRVVEVALAVKEELDSLGLSAAAKTSGSSGLHIFVPLPPKTSNDTALLTAQLIATRVAHAHPREATVERSVKARPPAAVYVDYLQNIRGKTVAAAYAARAKKGATVSTPLRWSELTPALNPRDFTIETVPARVASAGDLWAGAMRKKNSLTSLRRLGKR